MPLTIEYRPIVLPPELAGPVAHATAPAPGAAGRASLADRLGEFLRGDRSRRSVGTAVLGAVAAVTALGWNGGGGPAPQARAAVTGELQPFETAGQNFPGSAFYYLDSASGVLPARVPGGAEAHDPEARPLDARLGDAAARPTFLAGSGEDRFRAVQCLATAIYYEAATEPEAGQRAVAQVVLNRVAHPLWPNSVCGVVYQGSERPGCQFSFACDGSMARAPARSWWLRARAVAERALAGEVYAPVGLATYYHTGAVNPPWAARQVFVGAIGAHLFYRPSGAAGQRAAFTDAYWGGEPSPFPRPKIAGPVPGVALDNGRTAAPPPLPLPALTEALPPLSSPSPTVLPAFSGSGAVKAEYRNSGRWIVPPKD